MIVQERDLRVARCMDWLRDVTDPEIPVLSIVDLGLVRQVAFTEDDTCVVTVTPTYSGCPATEVIGAAIVQALQARGVPRVRVALQLAPAWTTDWMTDAGRAALAAYGIAPPGACGTVSTSALRHTDPDPACPRCGSPRTRMLSRFGSTACKSLHQCMACREPFDHFKPH